MEEDKAGSAEDSPGIDLDNYFTKDENSRIEMIKPIIYGLVHTNSISGTFN